MEREILNDLDAWKESGRRKPLLLTGVRQCGKTHALKEFGAKRFDDVCYVNFESSAQYASIFDYDFDVARIVRELERLEQRKIVPGRTLLVFDEIQEAPKAITSLKYFCENMRDLHVACAGSLLGVALKDENVSFPVGKVNRMQMHPMGFREFLNACDGGKYAEVLADWPVDREIPDLYAKPMERLFREYQVVGGMPEAVAEYAASRDFRTVEEIQDEILSDYADDFSKHAPAVDVEKIRMIWDSVPKQLAKENNKFVFSHVKEGKRAHELEGALQWLRNAGLVHLVELAQNAEPPLSANADATRFKVYLPDIGLLRRRLNVSRESLLGAEDAPVSCKGALAENYVLNELVGLGKHPYFWRSGNTAELDFLFEEGGRTVPVEVKAATNTQAKSYRLFCRKYAPRTGYKLSLKNIAVNDCEGTATVSLPLYLLWNMGRYAGVSAV